MFDKFMAIITLATMASFLGIIVLWVPDWDLALVCVIAVSACAFDFYRSSFSGHWKHY